jgi:hypothetical protein
MRCRFLVETQSLLFLCWALSSVMSACGSSREGANPPRGLADTENTANEKRNVSMEELTVAEAVDGEWDVLDRLYIYRHSHPSDWEEQKRMMPLLGHLTIHGTLYTFTPARGVKTPTGYERFIDHFIGERGIGLRFGPDTSEKGVRIPTAYLHYVPYLDRFTGECEIRLGFAPDMTLRAAFDSKPRTASYDSGSGEVISITIASISFPKSRLSTNVFLIEYSRNEGRLSFEPYFSSILTNDPCWVVKNP